MKIGVAALSLAMVAPAMADVRIDTIVAEEMASQRIPGVAVAVIRNGERFLARGYGLANVEHGVPVTDETIFQSGSVGKQFTAAIIMRLVEAGKLSLADEMTTFFPDAPKMPVITVRHLLTHTSGIPDYTEGGIDYRRDYTEDELARLAFEAPLDFAPGSSWKYSNTGYLLLGVIARHASGRFYGDLLAEQVFAPLGMTTARIISESDIVPHRAAGYRLEKGVLMNQEWVSPSLNTTADGSLYLSLRDMIAWDAGLRSGSILKPPSWAQVYEPATLASGRRHPYGFGWGVECMAGRTLHQHTGSWQGFKTLIARYQKTQDDPDLTVIVLANLAQADPKLIGRRVAEIFIPLLSAPESWVVTGALVADGTGAPLRKAHVRFEGGLIRDVGDLTPSPSERVLDGTGLVLAPGFIDTHNHSTDGLDGEPAAVTQVSQGITTVLLGQDGDSPWPIADYVARRRANGAAVNVALLVGHETVRRLVMGDDFRRVATRGEIAKMAALVAQGMHDGAFGLSSGLEYEVASYATTEEVVALAKAAGRSGGFYISHIRDEADRTLEAVAEAIAIGERARIPVQITHIKLGTVSVWGKAPEVIAMVEKARRRGLDVTADCYPYLAWHSNLKVLVPNKKWDDPASVKKALDDVGGGGNLTIVRLPRFPRYVGKTLADAAASETMTEVDLFMKIVTDDDAGIIGHTMREDDMRAFIRQPWTMISSDGGIGSEHPRGTGTFPRVLGRFVREEAWLTLNDAIRKMTSLPASRLKLTDRGTIRPGMKADLVLFDPGAILDRSTFESPRRISQGIVKVWVNGALAWDGDGPSGLRPGAVITP